MNRRAVFWTLAALAVLAAVGQAWALRWTCDDAFISLRYARHFAEGHGLVFNLDPAESPVEGYTNFSWTMLLALAVSLGFGDGALEAWASAWGIACHGGVVLLLAAMAWRASGGRALVPVAAVGYAAIHHAASLAPAGLETALFVLLVTAMLRACLALKCARAAWLLGFLGVLAALTRPDGAIPCAVAGLFVLHDALRRGDWACRRSDWRLVVGYAAPFVLVFAPYLLWRHGYYGHWLPNTFYAKSGADPHPAAGFVYARDFFVCYWPLLLCFPPLAWFALRKPDLLAAISPFLGRRPWLAVLGFVGSYLAFVLWVGGDFMFGRFLLPVLPALLFALDLWCLRWRAAWLPPALATIVALGCVFRVEPPGLDDPRNDVSDNRRISLPWIGPFREASEWLRPVFAGLDVRIAIAGGHANVAYRSRAPVAIECAAGLTDAYIARLPVPVRGKRGHDKPRDPAYLERRGAHFMLETNYQGDFGVVDTWRDVLFPAPPVGFPMRLVTWDRALMAELRRRVPGLQVVDFEQFLDGYLKDVASKPKAQVAADYAKFTGFYFAHNDDPARQAAFAAALR